MTMAAVLGAVQGGAATMRPSVIAWSSAWQAAGLLVCVSALGGGTPTRTLPRPLRIYDLVVSQRPQIDAIVEFARSNGLHPPPSDDPTASLLGSGTAPPGASGQVRRPLAIAHLPKVFDPRAIVGGAPSPETPFVVLVKKDGKLHCTATIIGPHTLLTAGHCVATTSASERMPPSTLSLSTDAGGFSVTDTLPHPDYRMQETPFSLTSDVGLLFTSADLSRATNLGAATIQRSLLTQVDCGSQAAFVGYGATSNDPANGPQGAGQRMATNLFFVCEADALTYGSVAHGTCFGDSGGPALAPARAPARVIGVTSFALRDLCDGGSKDARVDRFADWITANVR
jgi:hypothetical protein